MGLLMNTDCLSDADMIIKLIKTKLIDELKGEYKKRRIIQLDAKTVLEDIEDLLGGKTYKEIFYDNEN